MPGTLSPSDEVVGGGISILVRALHLSGVRPIGTQAVGLNPTATHYILLALRLNGEPGYGNFYKASPSEPALTALRWRGLIFILVNKYIGK